MSTSMPHLPLVERTTTSHIPGGFETDTEAELSDSGGTSELAGRSSKLLTLENLGMIATVNSLGHFTKDTKPINGFIRQANSTVTSHIRSLSDSQVENDGDNTVNNTALEEAEMNRKLDEFESSFYPEFSHLSASRNGGSQLHSEDNSIEHYSGGDNQNGEQQHTSSNPALVISGDDTSVDSLFATQSPQTPPNHYRTPAPEQQELRDHSPRVSEQRTPEHASTSRLEILSSSPMAARTVSRVQSMATIGGYETADDQDFPDSPSKRYGGHLDDPDATPRKDGNSYVVSSVADASSSHSSSEPATQALKPHSRRPKYLNSRSATSRLSYDSVASSATETSDATLGADFALQSGGAAPGTGRHRKPEMTLSRSTSLGSIVSGVSNLSDEEGAAKQKIKIERVELNALHEEIPNHPQTRAESPPSAMLVTPKPSNMNLNIPTDTVIANHVRDLEVPGTFARQYRQSQTTDVSPGKPLAMAAMTPSSKKGLTLKEHRSTVEKLGKENFDLKMKIHFLDQALQRRSEDGVREMITENVQLKSDRMRLEKESHGLRREVRELRKQLSAATGEKEEDQGYGTDEERRSPTAEEELLYLRERVEINEIELNRLRRDGIERESEKRKLAEMVRSLGERGGNVSDVGSREERDMWKDMLEAETIAREQSEEECKKLRDDIAKLRQDTFGNAQKLKRGKSGGSVVSRSSSVEGSSVGRSDNSEVERLRHEISELQKMIGAQASTLTSRNKEKERLYQEIEDLKLGRMGGLRSVAGDSILDRSASRARSNSRASNLTRFSRLSEPEREQFEIRVGELRDEVSHLKLTNQGLQSQLEEVLLELEAVDEQAEADAKQFNEELLLLTRERDNALNEAGDQDQAFQQLKNEAQEEIDGLGDELDAKVDECARLEEELKVQVDNVLALQAEMRSASEGLVRLEEDAQQNLARYQSVKTQLGDTTRELETFAANLAEAEGKIQRLTVQQESSHNEIAFLREEADGDKIKIGDLESLLKKVHLNLDSERDRAKDFERRLHEERRQRDMVTSQEKQEVQKVLNDLNHEASTAKEELRRAKKALSSREIEATTYKERLDELEGNLRQVLRDPNATRAGLITIVTKIQRELDHATTELDQTRQKVDEHQNMLTNRDVLLESSSLEYKKLSDLLERERQARRQDKHSFELSLKSHQQSARALTANNTRIAELEQQRQGHRKQLVAQEADFKTQLGERNQILLNLWKRLSTLCGPDWAHNHSLISGNLPSQEVVGNILFWPGFSRNLLLAAKQVEDTLISMKDKIKKVDRDLTKEYQGLSQVLEARMKKLERIEQNWEKMKLRQQEQEAGIMSPTHFSHRQGTRGSIHSQQQVSTPDVQKLKAENRVLKAELQLMQRQHSTHRSQGLGHQPNDSHASIFSGAGHASDGSMTLDGAYPVAGGGIPTRSTSMHRSSITRTQSASTIEPLGSPQMRRPQFDPSTNGKLSTSPDRASLMISTRPVFDLQPLPNGGPGSHLSGPNAALRKTSSGTVQTNASDAGTVNTAALFGMGQERWIHRLRELERRLKAEREQRLIDRTGMRKRLEEREAVNESLRKELERERVRRSWAEGDDAAAAAATGSSPTHEAEENLDLGFPRQNSQVHLASEVPPSIGRISLNNRVIDVNDDGGKGRSESSPVRADAGAGIGVEGRMR